MLVILRGAYYHEKSDITVSCEIPVPADILNIGGLSSIGSWLTVYRYFRRKKKEGFTIAHTYFNDSAMICPPVLKLLGYRILVSRRDMGYWYSNMILWVLRLNALFVDYVVANSRAVRDITIRQEHYRDDKVKVIYNGYQEFDNIAASEIKDIPLHDGEFRIVLVANIRPIKRIQDAIQAVGIVSSIVPEAVLYVIGDGDSSALETASSRYCVGDKVRYLGSRDDILKLLPMFDIGILCSESEGFSNTIIEYLQSGLPVVCSRVGGNPEIIEDGVNGYLYEMGDVPVLAACIEKLAGDEVLRKKLGSSGRDIVKNNYSLEEYIAHHERLYEELMV